jgi:hypothetical protein
MKASPVPEQVVDNNSELCLSRREEPSSVGYSEFLLGEPGFGDFIPEPLSYEIPNSPPDSGLSNEGQQLDQGFLPYDVAAFPLDTAPDSSGRRKGSCPVTNNPLPIGLENFNILSNPFIPSCGANDFTLCCKGVPQPVPRGSADMGIDGLALPELNNPDGLVNVGECINCMLYHHALEYDDSSGV